MAMALAIVTGLAVPAVSAQEKPSIKFSGLIFSYYAYTLSSPDGTEDGENGFDFRRINLTADFMMSDRFDGRFRVEAKYGTVASDVKPAVFVKDLSVRWKNALGEGHNVVFGVTSPPLWTVSEKQWGYRGLEATLMDRGKHASSRDMGIVFNGPVTESGSIKYGFMFANNSGGKAESDKYKRLYGQLEFYPNDAFKATAGADYYEFAGGSSLGANLFVGYTMDAARFGAEGFVNPKTIDSADDEDTRICVSLYGSYDINEKHRIICRFDTLDRDNLGVSSTNNWFIAGVSFRPDKGIEIIPNLIYNKDDSDNDPTLTGRLTVIASF